MFKLISYAVIGVILYWVGTLVHERYQYVTDRRAWLEQGRNMECTAQDRERMLAGFRSALFDPLRERAAAGSWTCALPSFASRRRIPTSPG